MMIPMYIIHTMSVDCGHPVIHSTLEDALRDIKKRCKDPKSVVFDLDGTLLIGKTPVAPLCKYYHTLCDRSRCVVTIVTARSSTIHGDTTNQLKKNRLDCFTEICLRDPKLSEHDFKVQCLSRLNPELAIGNRWHDLNIDDNVSLPDDAFIVGKNWLKVPR
jgi:hypothetical protein